MTVPLRSMQGLFGGVVFRNSRSSTDPFESNSVGVANVSVTMNSLSFGTERIEQRRVIRAGDPPVTYSQVPFGNPQRPGTMCSALTDEMGFFSIPFSGVDGSLAYSEASTRSSIGFLVGINQGVRFLHARNQIAENLMFVPGGEAARNALRQTLQPIDSTMDIAQDQVTEQLVGQLQESLRIAHATLERFHQFIEGSARIAQLISGITVPDNRMFLVKLVAIRL